MYIEIFDEMSTRDEYEQIERDQAIENGGFVSTLFTPKKASSKASLKKFAFAACRANHLVGIVID